MKMYFGHPVNFYNTEKESELIRIIEREFPQYEVENPNQPHHQEGYMRWWKSTTGKGMDYYFKEVLPSMSAGIFLPFDDGMWGAGVWGEAEFLHREGKPIYEITAAGIITPAVPDISKMLSIDETRKRVYRK